MSEQRLIDANDVRNALWELAEEFFVGEPDNYKFNALLETVDPQPTIEPTTPRGHWTVNTDDFTPAWRCSNCGYNKPMLAGESAKQEPKSFCSNCGADMRGAP